MMRSWAEIADELRGAPAEVIADALRDAYEAGLAANSMERRVGLEGQERRATYRRMAEADAKKGKDR